MQNKVAYDRIDLPFTIQKARLFNFYRLQFKRDGIAEST